MRSLLFSDVFTYSIIFLYSVSYWKKIIDLRLVLVSKLELDHLLTNFCLKSNIDRYSPFLLLGRQLKS
jgi:hypothetical protein